MRSALRRAPQRALFAAAAAWAMALAVAPLAAQDKPTSGIKSFEVDPVHSALQFKVRHIISMVPGQFRAFSGSVEYDPTAPTSLTARATVQVASIDTGNPKRDEHLKSPDFFDAANHPTLEFRSTKAEAAGEGKIRLTGDLTMRGVTKPITLDMTVLGVAPGFGGATLLGLEGKTTVSRKDFNILWNRTLDSGGTVLGDEVELTIQIEAAHKPPAPEGAAKS